MCVFRVVCLQRFPHFSSLLPSQFMAEKLLSSFYPTRIEGVPPTAFIGAVTDLVVRYGPNHGSVGNLVTAVDDTRRYVTVRECATSGSWSLMWWL